MANDYKYIDRSVITKVDDITKFYPGPNMVLVKPELDTTIAGEKAKIHIDTFFEHIEYARRIVRIISVPTWLMIKGTEGITETSYKALDWHTEMELKTGDLAWVDPIAVVNNNDTLDTNCYECDGELYFAIRYDKFIVAKRGDQTIMLNGYILILKVEKFDDEFSLYPKISHCVVTHIGAPNKFYNNSIYSDMIEVNVGDHINNPRHFFPLEGCLHREFEDGKAFYMIQRRHIHLNFGTHEH